MSLAGVLCALLSRPLAAQTVSNVRALQLADRTVEVLYDLSGAAAPGATVSVAFSGDAGATWDITPAASALSGHVGAGVANGSDRRVVWNAAATLEPNAFGTSYRAAVTATDPPSGLEELTVTLPGGVPLVLVRIPAGTFLMGSTETERGRYDEEGPQHEVTLTSDYYIGKHEVTQAQWLAVMGSNPSAFTGCGGDCPVENVSWNDVRKEDGFIAKLNALLGTTKFRLPTEAEWERAARGNTGARFSFGDALDGDDSCEANPSAEPYVWWCANGGLTNHAVGAKGANPYGLYDVHGQVSEWVEDWYGPYTASAKSNPTGASSGIYRIIRGGNRLAVLRFARSAARGYWFPSNFALHVGFRVGRDL